uniref:Uncharacterized protein n=1 Tax=Physcomitrium patens TaxID=3218 RepID=A0A2K1ING7_PHYPA|nr:uncharacterized protein LOC112274903 [Physcomitrium patens]PNR30822.1 hypothetical protein PHYPA_027138 [Physcomitrium patens]|eukprot:XP_024360523.1 uncharacterized protein LOC112274903 [Physcomitrella patens]
MGTVRGMLDRISGASQMARIFMPDSRLRLAIPALPAGPAQSILRRWFAQKKPKVTPPEKAKPESEGSSDKSNKNKAKQPTPRKDAKATDSEKSKGSADSTTSKEKKEVKRSKPPPKKEWQKPCK